MTPSNASRAPLPRRLWVEMTTCDFERLPADTVAVLPVAAVEQHGPHLPVYVDACINEGVIARTIAKLPQDLPVTFLPMQAIGKSNEHIDFPGTLTLSADTLARLWTEIGESVHRAGIRKLVLFNSHGGQPQVMDIVARDLRVRLDMLVVCASSYAFGGSEGLFPPEERRHGIHGGSSETSRMLALRPDLVRMELAQNFVPASVQIEQDYEFLYPDGSIGFGWKTQDLHPLGACGNALDADATRGNALLDHTAASLAKLLAEVHRFPITQLRERAP